MNNTTNNNRFETIYKETSGLGVVGKVIILDKETGVQYLYIAAGSSGSITPLLGTDGKPIITPVSK